MEYVEAINSDAFAEAVKIARRLHGDGKQLISDAASQAVAQAYCVCVTDGEDAAEHQFSEVHSKLIDDVARCLRTRTHKPSDGRR